MNECPLPSPLLVLRDVYKSRSPGQPAEFHETPRRRSERPNKKRTTNKSKFELLLREKLRTKADEVW